ncbi:MAG: N-glycosylase/DNA lyase [Nanoarchaeota archaeon]|nr:N-glycosylase/DNA lyase [Nanoarchaeota archaeon]
MILFCIKNEYGKRKKEIKSRLKEFKNNKDVFYELCFCLLTPQSNAYKCWDAVEELKKKDFFNKNIKVENILKSKTRFYKNKSKYLYEMKNKFNDLKFEREFLVENVKGLSYKESSHFLRNIGHRNYAILDRHILKNLLNLKVVQEIPKNLNKKNYLEIENKFRKFSDKIGIEMDELDLLFWSLETGKVFR